MELKEGEYGLSLRIYLKNADGSAYTSLAGTETIKLWINKDGGTAADVGTGSIYSTTTGEVRIAIASGDCTDLTEGTYLGEIEVTAAGVTPASVLISNDVEVIVKRRIGGV